VNVILSDFSLRFQRAAVKKTHRINAMNSSCFRVFREFHGSLNIIKSQLIYFLFDLFYALLDICLYYKTARDYDMRCVK